jgi:DNA-binding response OmpR family regulator
MGPRRILVAEDDRAIDGRTREALERAGHVVLTVTDGHQALSQYRAFRPDLILLDVRLRKEDGCRVSRLIKSLARANPELKEPAILLLAGERESVKVDYAKADGVLDKPFTADELVGRVEALLSGAATPAA